MAARVLRAGRAAAAASAAKPSGADAWGQRVAWDGGDVFLRYSWGFDAARDLVLG